MSYDNTKDEHGRHSQKKYLQHTVLDVFHVKRQVIRFLLFAFLRTLKNHFPDSAQLLVFNLLRKDYRVDVV
jgi:hypothetical protein